MDLMIPHSGQNCHPLLVLRKVIPLTFDPCRSMPPLEKFYASAVWPSVVCTDAMVTRQLLWYSLLQ